MGVFVFLLFKLLSLSIPNDGKARVKNTKRALTSFESILKMFPHHEFDVFSPSVNLGYDNHLLITLIKKLL